MGSFAVGMTLADGSKSTFTGEPVSDLQSFDQSQSIRGTRKIFPILGERHVFKGLLEDRLIYFDADMMLLSKMTADWTAWIAVVTFQADKGAVLRFATK